MIGRIRLIIYFGLGLFLILTACIVTDESTTIIKIDGGDFQELAAKQLLQDAELIPLETSTSCMLGEGAEFINHSDGFYVLDKDDYSCLYHFEVTAEGFELL